MDVYKLPPYPYQQNDDIVKQPFTQASSLPLSKPPINSIAEAHTMPAPTGTPWNVQGMSWGMLSPPDLVQFTAARQDERFLLGPQCKRKSTDGETVIPSKMRITEEKMAAHLSGLHISHEYTPHALAHNDIMDINMESSNCTAGQKPTQPRRIILADEIKKIQEEPLIPPAIIDRLEKPHMSLVVWKPKESIFEMVKEEEPSAEEREKQRLKLAADFKEFLRRNGDSDREFLPIGDEDHTLIFSDDEVNDVDM